MARLFVTVHLFVCVFCLFLSCSVSAAPDLGRLVAAHRAEPDSKVGTQALEDAVRAGLPPHLDPQWLPDLPLDAASLPYGLGMLVVPKAFLPTETTEPQHGEKFSKVSYLYTPGTGAFSQSSSLFCTVHYTNSADAPLAGRIARLLALAHQTLVAKTGHEAANGMTPFDVWLCTGGPTGGEQWRSNLYLYHLESLRSSIEWLREVIHEYSHLALPAVGGYDAPEYWANGYLGERLLVRWLIRQPDGPAEVSAVWGDFSGAPNFERLLIAPPLALYKKIGPNPRWLARKDELGMRYLIGQALTFDDKYGSAELGDALSRLPRFHEATARDFAAALTQTLSAHP